MNFKFRIKRWLFKWQQALHKKTKLLPDQQNILDNWTNLLRNKNTKPYYCRVRDERVVVLFDDEDEQDLRKMLILKEGGGTTFYELLYTEIKVDGSKIIIDTELDAEIAKIFIDRFDEVIFRRIINLEKLRKNMMNESIGSINEQKSELIIHDEIDLTKIDDSKLLKSGLKINDSLKNN